MIYFKKILCPIDYSDCSAHALRYAVKMALKDSALLYLMYVEDEGVFDYGGLRFDTEHNPDSEAVARMEQKLRNSVPEEFRDFSRIETLVAMGVPGEEIVKTALDKNVDLIVMGTHGRTGIMHMVIGSVAENVIRDAPCPVLCIKNR